MPTGLPLWKRPRAQLYTVTVIVWALVLAIVFLAWHVLLPFLLAALAAYVIDPVIARMAAAKVGGHRVPRAAAVGLVYAVLGVVVYVLAVSVFPAVYREAMRGLLELRDALTGVTPEKVRGWTATIDLFLRRYGIPLDVTPGGAPTAGGRFSVDLAAGLAEALQETSAFLRGRVGDVVAFSRAIVTGTFQTLFFVILLFMLTAFISMDAPRILGFFETLVPTAWRPDFRKLVRGIDAGLSGVVRGQLTIMVVNGALTLVGLLVLKVPFAFALGFLAFLLYVVPLFGTILSSVPIVLLALTAGGLSKGLLALGWILAIHGLETYVLNPKIMGDASKIHPVLIVLALVVGERTFGIVGALLAVPVMSVFVAVFRFLHRKLAELDARAAAQPGSNLLAAPDAAPTEPLTKGSTQP
jgi:predicted PurR-regulated permease PerM